MNSAKVESILARCIVEPVFLDALEREPHSALNHYGLDPELASEFANLDWKRFRSFAGLITKVQNNGLWQHFHYTRKLLAYYKLDLRLFTLFREQHLHNKANRISRDAQTLSFLQFLRIYIASLPIDYPGLVAIMQHEQWSWEINRELREVSEQSMLHKRKVTRSSPNLRLTDIVKTNGVIRVGEFKHDPLEIVEILKGQSFDGTVSPERASWRCYWGKSVTDDLRIFELSEQSAKSLMFVNCRRSVRQIIACAKRMRIDDIVGVLKHGIKTGLLSPWGAAASE